MVIIGKYKLFRSAVLSEKIIESISLDMISINRRCTVSGIYYYVVVRRKDWDDCICGKLYDIPYLSREETIFIKYNLTPREWDEFVEESMSNEL